MILSPHNRSDGYLCEGSQLRAHALTQDFRQAGDVRLCPHCLSWIKALKSVNIGR